MNNLTANQVNHIISNIGSDLYDLQPDTDFKHIEFAVGLNLSFYATVILHTEETPNTSKWDEEDNSEINLIGSQLSDCDLFGVFNEDLEEIILSDSEMARIKKELIF